MQITSEIFKKPKQNQSKDNDTFATEIVHFLQFSPQACGQAGLQPKKAKEKLCFLSS